MNRGRHGVGMKVKVKNLGVLKQAEFSLGDLTIICGGNNTGKTYATYALYGFLSTWRRNIAPIPLTRIPDRVMRALWNDGVTRIDLRDYVRKADQILDDICRRYTQDLSDIFAASEEKFKDTEFHVSLENDKLEELVKSTAFERLIGAPNRQLVSIATTKGSTELEISLFVDKQNKKIPSIIIKNAIRKTISTIVFAQFFPDPFISSAERTGTAIFRRELNFARERLLKEMTETEDEIDPRELLSQSYQDYALPVEDNLDFALLLENIARKKSFLAEEYPDVLKQFADIIGGSYRTRNNELYFIPKGTKIRLSMGESSSGVRSMVDIGFYLRHTAERGDLLMVDEPELNLHPENQRRIAQLFARLANLGIKVFITTHSDYIVKELNTLIMLSQDKPYLKRIAQQEGYESSELIAPEKIKAYIAEEALVLLDGNKEKSPCLTLIEAKIDPELGIEMGSFDKTINKMNEIQEAIVWGDDE